MPSPEVRTQDVRECALEKERYYRNRGERARRDGTAASPSLWRATLESLLALVLILIGAEIFVGQIIDLSASLGINATVLALIIAPFATELPKKVNSVLWVRQGKLLSRSGR
jgi:Ca2+/Na+ antiporter